MSDKKPELSPNLHRLSAAIRGHGAPVQAAFCGFDLYLEVMSCDHMSMADFLTGGKIADGSEDEGVLKVPMPTLGGRIIISFDPTVAPDQFYLKP